MAEGGDRLTWLREIFDKKRKDDERERARVEAERVRRSKFLSQCTEFWERVKGEVYTAVDYYNKNVRQAEWLARHDMGKDTFLIEKTTEPSVRLEVGLNRMAEEIGCHFEYANLPEMTYKVKVGEQGLFLELEGHVVPDGEVAMWMLKDLVLYTLRS